jgi:hypothetical protein
MSHTAGNEREDAHPMGSTLLKKVAKAADSGEGVL